MTLREKVPSTGALFAFDAAVRHGSFTSAAREFNVTQPAISRTISTLEKDLGCELFERRPSGLVLTENGRKLHIAINRGFGEIEGALDAIRRDLSEAQAVTLSITSAFAIHGLMPRLNRLREDLPHIALRFELIHGEPVGPFGGANLAVRFAWKEVAGYSSEVLFPEIVLPVCSPAYLERNGRLDAHLPHAAHVLAVQTGPLRVPWDAFWTRCASGSLPEAGRIEFSDYSLLIQSALKGQCVALGWGHVACDELLSGGLVPACNAVLRTGDSFSLVAKTDSRQVRKSVEQVFDWLIAEFAQLRTELDRLTGATNFASKTALDQ